MQAATARTIDAVVRTLVNHGNSDVYETRLNTSDAFRVVPYVIYFYYIKFENDGKPWVRHYRYQESNPITAGQLGLKVRELAIRVRAGDTTLEDAGRDFKDIKWKHKSYIVIFMDSPYWKVLRRVSDPNRSAVVFNTNKGGKPNHSFFDADDLPINMPATTPPTLGDTGDRVAVYFINHMKKSDFGDDLGDHDQHGNPIYQEEKFSFDVYFDVSDGAAGPSTVFIIDPDGTNMGPPLGPP